MPHSSSSIGMISPNTPTRSGARRACRPPSACGITNGISEMWVISVARRPRPRSGWCDHFGMSTDGGADAEDREDRPALGVHVEERQVDQVAVVGPQVDVARADAAGPDALAWVCTTALGLLVVPEVNMIPNGRIGSMGTAPLRRRHRRTGRRRRRAVRRSASVAGRRCVVVTAIHFSAGAAVGHMVDELRLGDGGDAPGLAR